MTGRTDNPSVVVAGGGLIGLCTAWALVGYGYRVRLIDAGRVGREASWAGGGILFPIYPWKYPLAVQRLAQRGRTIYDAFTREVDAVSGIDSENRRTGLCVLDANEAEAAEAWAAAHEEPIETLRRAELQRLQPGLASGTARYFPNAAQVRNPRLCRSLAVALRARGAEITEHCPARSVASAGGRFIGFDTDQERVAADYGVVACGAWSTAIVAGIAPLPITPVKGQMIVLEGQPGQLGPVLLQGGRYVIPRSDGRIVVGSTVEHAGFDYTIDADTASQLKASAAAMLPALGDLPICHHWAGLRPATVDELPAIGALPGVDGLYINAGHYRNGVLCAPSSAELLGRLMQGRGQPADAVFDPGRFQSEMTTSTCR